MAQWYCYSKRFTSMAAFDCHRVVTELWVSYPTRTSELIVPLVVVD